MFQRIAWVALVVAVTACSSSGSSGGTGSGSGGDSGSGFMSSAPPDAFIFASVGGSGASCPLAAPVTPWLSVGTPTASKPTTVADQGATGSGTATIACTVHPSGHGFDIALSVSVAGAYGGEVTITSPSGAGAVTESGATGITASFQSVTTPGTYTATDCALTFTYNGMPVSVSPAIASGRIWGHVVCADAASGPNKCGASADFLFEQCQP